MKNLSIRTKLNLWYTLLLFVLGISLVVSMAISANVNVSNRIKQDLIRNVERNIDEVEIEDGNMNIEKDFAFEYSGISSVVLTKEGKIIDGAFPDDIEIDLPFQNGEIRSVYKNGRTYFVYDSLIEFKNYEYKINGETGQIQNSECECADIVEKYEGNTDIKEKGCKLTIEQAYEIALNNAGIDKEKAVLIFVEVTHTSGYPIYSIEFYTDTPIVDDVWVRGVTKSSQSATFNAQTYITSVVILFIIAFSAGIGLLLTKKALSPLNEFVETVSGIDSAKDLSKRIETEKNDPQINRLAENFNIMLASLEKAFESERQFTGDASHELRTPITVILAECDYQLERKDLGEDERESITSIRNQALSMKKLIIDLLNMSRLEQNSLAYTFSLDNFSLLLSAVCDNAEISAKKKNITIETDIPNDIMLNMESSLIARMSDNLISNAIKYGKEGGFVKVSLSETENRVVLIIIDNGIGIEKSEQEKIFNRFYRVDKARNREDGSTGLGLAMVKEIVYLHKGKITLESDKGVGSKFSVIFQKNV